MHNAQLEFGPSTPINVTVMSRHRRPREYLTEAEIEKLIKAASANRQGHRDATAIRIAYRHGLRGSGVVGLRPANCTCAAARPVRLAFIRSAAESYGHCVGCNGKCRRACAA